MKKFMFIYYSDVKHSEVSDDKKKEVMDKWVGWFDSMSDSVSDKGAPFQETAKSVMASGVEVIPDEMWPAKGYTVINANDIDEAVEIAKGCPAIVDDEKGATVRVYEIMPM